MKAIKIAFLKLIVMLLILMGVIVAYFTITYEETEDPTESISTATLPVIKMKYENQDINLLHGYTTQMQGQYMRDTVTPYGEDGMIELDIVRYQNVIAEISYEIRTVDTARLIDSGDIREWSMDGEEIYLSLKMSNIMQPDEEYLLIITLLTETHGKVYYYVRVKQPVEDDIKNQLAFVSDFSKSAIAKQASDKYSSYLEYKPSADHSNFAYVNIYSSYHNIDWGDMTVTRESNPVVMIKELLGTIGSYELQYKVKALDEYGNEQYYNVYEYFRLRTLSNGNMYLDVYERQANQIFNPNTQSISTKRINLGLDNDLDVHYKTSPSGSYITFEKEGNLFMLDMEKNTVVEIFAFDTLTEEDMRIDNRHFDIEILSTDKNGNTMFLVYGYMAKGAHEGQVGVALYRYQHKEGNVKEMVFVPSDRPFSVFKDSVGKFAYLSEEELLYFMVGNSIYTVTMDSNEYMQLVTGLTSGNYSINQYNNILAWHENATIYDADSIRVIDVDAKKDYIIQADEGEKLKIIGFIGNDLVYGVAKETDIYIDASGQTVFPMYKVHVVVYENETENETITENIESHLKKETYEKPNIYITGVSIKENVMTFTRKIKTEDGSFADTTEDKYVNKKGEDKALVSVETISTELKKKELVMMLPYTITSENKLAVKQVENIEFVTANTLNLSQSEYISDNYYVYGANGMEQIFTHAADAITYANNIFGTVVSKDGRLFWGRVIKPDLAKLSDTSALVSKAYTSLDMVKADTSYEVTDISGVEFSTLLYYGTRDIPIVAWTKEYGCVIMSAYSGYQGNVDTFAFTVCQGGEIVKMSYAEAKQMLESAGAKYLVVQSK